MMKTVDGRVKETVAAVRASTSSARTDFPSPPVWIEVDLAAVRHNLRQIRQLIGPRVQILAVVKANAYGHGLAPVAEALVDSKADGLGVASVREGVALREHGIRSKILVLGQILPEEAPLVVGHGLTQAIGDIHVAQALSRAAAQQEKEASVHLKIDTGMGRYGVWHEEAIELSRRIAQLPALRVEGVFTHLATAGQDAEAAEEQMRRFFQVIQRLHRGKLPAGLKHVANSVSLLKFPAARQDLVRTGLLLYGASPIREGHLPVRLKPVLSLKSRIQFLKTVPTGQTVSYGATFKASRPTKVATIPVGYAHGYTRALSNRAQLLVRGIRASVIGRITMEDLMADVTDVPGVRVGDEVVLIGRQGREQITAEELARHARTIPYEILAGLSPSIQRIYS
ncbi:MAG: alanine racemase [Candidatus Omnitrophica bacterium]|nr:alanine racemase [Candidatus Omnitrophota bacterium]